MTKELSQANPKDPKKQMEDAFKAMRKGFEQKLREEFGPEIIDEFVQRIEEAIRQAPEIPEPHRMREQILTLTERLLGEFKNGVDERIRSIMAVDFEAAVKRVWVDFIRNEINLKLEDPSTIIRIAKKIKELP